MKSKGSSLVIPAITLPDGSLSQPQSLDLTAYQGMIVRIYIDSAGIAHINPQQDRYWQLCEINLPAVQHKKVLQGTVTHTTTAERTVIHRTKATDIVKLVAGESIARVGFSWAVYQPEIDYNIAGGVITWLNKRQPIIGDGYNVEIITTITEPDMIDQPLALDLTSLTITTFPTPK